MKNLIAITDDLFDIANRLKAIDQNYRVFFNVETQKFEVHNMAQRLGTLAFVVPFDELDARTVQYARFTRVENAQKLFDEVDKHNQSLEKTCLDIV